MDKTFNELFDDFFSRNNKADDQFKNELKKMLDKLAKSNDSIDENMEKKMDESLGTPDVIEFYNEGPMFYERRIWETPNGKLVKLIVTDDPSLVQAPIPEKSLEEQLEEAVANEEFEKAAAIRDKMLQLKKPRRCRKKAE